jgi:hypothetical protein
MFQQTDETHGIFTTCMYIIVSVHLPSLVRLHQPWCVRHATQLLQVGSDPFISISMRNQINAVAM